MKEGRLGFSDVPSSLIVCVCVFACMCCVRVRVYLVGSSEILTQSLSPLWISITNALLSNNSTFMSELY